MKIAIIGAGAVGGYFGGRLLQAGHDVRFVARGKNLEILRTRGLRLESAKGDFAAEAVNADEGPAALEGAELAIIAVKTYQLAAAIASLGPALARVPSVLPLLNGVEAADILARELPAEHVLGGWAAINAQVSAPGVIRQIGPAPAIGFGELDGRASERVEAIRAALEGAGITPIVPPSVQVRVWTKFVGMAGWTCVGATANASIDELLAVEDTRKLLRSAMNEAAAVGRARGVALPDNVADKAIEMYAGLVPGTRTSLEHDVAAGRPSELEAYSGFVVRAGRAAGIAVPVHEVLYALLLPRERRVVSSDLK